VAALWAAAGALLVWALVEWLTAQSCLGLTLGLLMLITATASTAGLVRGVAAAMGEVANAARQIANRDLRVRLPLGPTREVEELSAAFSQMVASLTREREAWDDGLRNLEVRAHEQAAEVVTCQHQLNSFRAGLAGAREHALSVQGCANLLSRDCGSRLDPRGREYLDRIRASAEALECILHELLLRPDGPSADADEGSASGMSGDG
jgi:HAMP domain-containing protein